MTVLARRLQKEAPAGTAVLVVKDNGDVVRTVTRSAVQPLNEHRNVVFLDGIAGYYAADRVFALVADPASSLVDEVLKHVEARPVAG